MRESCLSMTASEQRVTISRSVGRSLISTSRKRVNTSREYHVEAKISPSKDLASFVIQEVRIFFKESSPERRLTD